MAITFEEFIERLVDYNEENKFTVDEIKDITNEFNSKNEEVSALKTQLEEKSNQYDELKDRVLNELFFSSKGKAEEPENIEKEPEEQHKTFKDIIDSRYEIRR